MVSEDKIDMSLDDIIASNKKTTRGRGGRGRGRGSSRGAGGRGASRGRRDSGGPVRQGRGGSRSAPYNRPNNVPDKWEHDMYDGAGSRGGRKSDGGRPGITTGSHLQISNLDFGVTETDVKELFAEFGKLKKATINYDSSGRSHGTADVIFERKDDAAKAFKTYNGVPLDGRAMKIEQVTPQVSTNIGRRDTSNNYGSVRNTRLGGRGGGGGGNRGARGSSRGGSTRGGARGASRGGRGGRGGGRGKGRGPPPSKEDLDKELDSYIEAAN